MPKRTDIKKILVIGSGPIVIGQGAEFDYSGTQGCLSLKEEGYEVILINSNPATIMTDSTTADKVYIEPLTEEFIGRIIRKDKPQGLIASLGGQTSLNMAVKLARSGILDEEEVELLGTSLESIEKGEDREKFRDLMFSLGQPVPESIIVKNVKEAVEFGESSGFPLVVRPAFTLGGTGGGIVHNMAELKETVKTAVILSPINQCLLEKYLGGYKEIEFEVMRDSGDNCITICSLENMDPVGIHTGDSIVVAPTLTLNNMEYQMLRSASLDIIRALKVVGGCNIQFALDPNSSNYYVIEVNPRVSRSSALASKATGYPIAKFTAKLAVGYHLDEISNPVTGMTLASFEPVIDYIVTKIPRWPFEKFIGASRELGTQMKATGEIMSIGRTFEESLLKGLRSLETGNIYLDLKGIKDADEELIISKLKKADDERLYYIAQGLRRGLSVEDIQELTKISRFFIDRINKIIQMEGRLKENKGNIPVLYEAKRMGFPDRIIGQMWDTSEDIIRENRLEGKIVPSYKMVDTCGGEFEATTSYFYSTYEEFTEWTKMDKESVVILGSGPIRIGQGIEFDYSTVHGIMAIRDAGYKAIVINNNPETVSTDFSIADRLYFEPLYLEDVLNIINIEEPLGVILQFGGQTAIKLADALSKRGIPILGTQLKGIDIAEDRKKFEKFIRGIGGKQPAGDTAVDEGEAVEVAQKIGFPLLVRPSYVLGGQGMEIVNSIEEVREYVGRATAMSEAKPILLDSFLKGIEVEVDGLSDGKDVFVPDVMEHVERAGVHSGDSIAIYPSYKLTDIQKKEIYEITKKVALGLKVVGLLNIQFVVADGEIYIIEVNPRASRTVPFIGKATGIPLAKLATLVMLGKSLKELGIKPGMFDLKGGYWTKVPVFSFSKLKNAEIVLGPEMKSTGEVMGHDITPEKALYKGLIAAGFKIPKTGSILFTLADKDKEEGFEHAKRFHQLGFSLYGTSGTSKAFSELGVPVRRIKKLEEGNGNILDALEEGKIDMVVNTFTKGKTPMRDGFKIRRKAAEHNIPVLTSLDTIDIILKVLENMNLDIKPIREEIRYGL